LRNLLKLHPTTLSNSVCLVPFEGVATKGSKLSP